MVNIGYSVAFLDFPRQFLFRLPNVLLGEHSPMRFFPGLLAISPWICSAANRALSLALSLREKWISPPCKAGRAREQTHWHSDKERPLITARSCVRARERPVSRTALQIQYLGYADTLLRPHRYEALCGPLGNRCSEVGGRVSS